MFFSYQSNKCINQYPSQTRAYIRGGQNYVEKSNRYLVLVESGKIQQYYINFFLNVMKMISYGKSEKVEVPKNFLKNYPTPPPHPSLGSNPPRERYSYALDHIIHLDVHDRQVPRYQSIRMHEPISKAFQVHLRIFEIPSA